MALYAGGQLARNVYQDGARARGVYLDGNPVWLPAGLPPAPVVFEVTPDQVQSDAVPATIAIRFQRPQIAAVASRLTSASLTEHLADGATRVIADTVAELSTPAGSSESFLSSPPSQDAHYVLEMANVNGRVIYTRDYHYGLRPTIAYFRSGGFRQGVSGITPNAVLIEWSVTGAQPPADLDITTDRPSGFHYHPQRIQSGSYRYSQQGAAGRETLTLTARNLFATVSRQLVIEWP